jgi:tetratricopeptide (TPR) repeat protein
MNDRSVGQRSRSPNRAILAITGCILAGIGIGLASTQVVYGQELVPAPPVDVDPDDPVPGLEALPRKRDDNLIRTNVLLFPSDFGTEIQRLPGSNLLLGGDLEYTLKNTLNGLLSKAFICKQEEKFDKALEYYNQAIVCSPGNMEAHGNRANVLISLGRLSEALDDLDFVIQQESVSIADYAMRGASVLISLRQCSDPLKDLYLFILNDLYAFIQQGSDVFRAYAMRGYVRCLLVKSDSDDKAYEPAMADITRALELSPDVPFARFVRGMIAARRGNNDGAIADLSWAIENGCDHQEALYYRGLALAMKGETDRAIPDLTEALKSYPNDPALYAWRAQLYVDKEDFDRALADFDQLVRLQPNDALVYLQRSILFLCKGDNRRAMVDIEQVVRLEPRSAFARFVHAIMLYFMEPKSDRALALAEMDRAIDLEPGGIVYPAFRCFLNGNKTKYGPAFRDLALCTAILLQSRIKTYVGADLTLNRFGIAVDLGHDHRKLKFLANIDFRQQTFFLGMGIEDDSEDLQHSEKVSEYGRRLINQNVLNVLAAKFVGASH